MHNASCGFSNPTSSLKSNPIVLRCGCSIAVQRKPFQRLSPQTARRIEVEHLSDRTCVLRVNPTNAPAARAPSLAAEAAAVVAARLVILLTNCSAGVVLHPRTKVYVQTKHHNMTDCISM